MGFTCGRDGGFNRSKIRLELATKSTESAIVEMAIAALAFLPGCADRGDGCTTLCSKDFNSGQMILGVKVVNPDNA
jgi:hypothetical protein